mgnify:CR=1 FL=1
MTTPSYITELIADAVRVDDLELLAICEAAQRGDDAALRSGAMIQGLKQAGDVYLSPHSARPTLDPLWRRNLRSWND